MYDPDKFKNKAARTKPSQARGKERVRLILAAALQLLQERGLDDVTTNDIAERARIPIGSLYRYYPNKDSIIIALTDLYVEDIARIFDQVGQNPILPTLSWEEVLVLLVDGWVNYSRLNGPFALLYAERANPRLRKENSQTWERFYTSFGAVINRRCPSITERQTLICFNFCLAAAEMGISDDQRAQGGEDMYLEALSVIADYMEKCCLPHNH